MWVRILGAMKGRRHGRCRGVVGDAGGCEARVCRHLPTSRGCRRGWGGLGVPSRGAAAGAVSHAALGWLQFPRGRQCGATPLSTRYGEPPVCATARHIWGSGCHRLPWIGRRHTHRLRLDLRRVFVEVQACTDAELYCRQLCWTRPCCEPC